MTVKAIVFDLGGVIFTSDGWSYETRERLAKELNINSRILQDFWFERRDKMITGKMTEDEYLKEFLTKTKMTISLDKMKEFIRSNNIIDNEMLDLLKQLKKNYPVFALTNDVSEWLEYRINKFNLNQYFDLIISSSDVGLAKPDVAMYECLLEKLNLKPEEIVFIDNRKENIVAAVNLGIKSFHFTNREKFQEWLKEEKIL